MRLTPELIESLHAPGVAGGRRVAPSRRAEVDALADKAPLLRDDAVTGRLVDRIGFRDEAYARIGELVGAPGISPETGDADSEDAPPRLYLSRYAKATASRPSPPMPSVPGRKSKPTIAVVTLHGPIVSGRGGPQVLPFGNSSAGGDTIAAALREAAADDSVSAIVLRVDSPGGSVTGSETVWREVNRVRDGGKPVVASMGAVAASGGYYVSMSADAIVANAGTITGSIGVMTGKLVARELKDRLGVGSDSVRTNANADAWSINQPFTDEQHAHVEAQADLFYTDFVERVAAGRKMTVEAVDAVARGGSGRGPTRWSTAWSTSSAACAPRSAAPRCWPASIPTTTSASVHYPGLVVDGHAAAQAVVAACGGIGARGAGRPGGSLGGGCAQPGRQVAHRRQRALVGRVPLLAAQRVCVRTIESGCGDTQNAAQAHMGFWRR